MKILLIAHGSTLNGAERSFLEMLKVLSVNHQLFVIFPNPGPIIEECKKYIYSYTFIHQPWWTDRGENFSATEKIKRLKEIIIWTKRTSIHIRDIDPDLVITNTSVIPCGALGAWLTRKRHIWYLRELGKEDHGFKFLYGEKLSHFFIRNLSFRLFFNSYFTKNKYIKKNTSCNKYYVLSQSVNIETYKNINNTTDVLIAVMVGRFSESKGQMEAIKAFEYLNKIGERTVKLLLVGAARDKYSFQLMEYVQKNGLANNIKIIGFSPLPALFYAQSHIALVCSRCEAFGRITIESMKMGLPVIASNTGANPELIKEGFNGYLYEYGNEKELAEKIILLKDKSLRERIGSSACLWANENFNQKQYALELNNAINE